MSSQSRKLFISAISAGAMTLAGLTGVGQVAAAQANANTATETLATAKAPKPKTGSSKMKIVSEVGGMPINTMLPMFGLTPKEYGMRYGSGVSKRSNRLRYSHNAKLKRRNSK